MSTILIIFAIILITWEVVYNFFYSPKAQIKRLWKEVFIIEHEISKYNSEDSVADSFIKAPYENAIRRKKKMINALLNYCFNPEEDREYLEENRPD